MQAFAKRAARSKHLRGLVRVGLYAMGVTLICGVFSARRAHAELQDKSLIFGREMAQLAHASSHDVTQVTLNGQLMHVGNSSTDDAPDAVLARYEEHCNTNRTWENMYGQPGTKVQLTGAQNEKTNAIAGAGAIRSKSANDGAVICFVKGPESKTTAKEAFESFFTTGKLGAIGELRYAYASRAPSGRTLVLTAWTDSSFNINDLVPEDGKDAKGEDFPELPRVPNSLRVMSGRAVDAPYGVNVYRTHDSPEQTLAFYDKSMKAAGWFTYDPEMTEEEHGGLSRSYMKDAVVLTLGTSKQPDGNYVAVGLSGVAKREQHP